MIPRDILTLLKDMKEFTKPTGIKIELFLVFCILVGMIYYFHQKDAKEKA